MKTLRLLTTLLFSLILTVAAHAGTPTEKVKASTERVLALLKDPNLHGDAKKSERRKMIREELDARFDLAQTAHGCLGRHWAERTPAEQKEFIKIFSDFLETTYLDKFDAYYVNVAKIDYKGEKIVDGGFASVKIVLTTTSNVDHPVEYRLEKAGGDDWRIYDTVIEGVSLIKNYRDQFDSIIQKSGYQGLVDSIKAKNVGNL